MLLNSVKLIDTITNTIDSVNDTTLLTLSSKTVTVGQLEGMQVKITVTRDDDEFSDKINPDNDCIDEHAEKPELGQKCVIWHLGEVMIDQLTTEDHYEAYWEESMLSFGDEDKFIVL